MKNQILACIVILMYAVSCSKGQNKEKEQLQDNNKEKTQTDKIGYNLKIIEDEEMTRGIPLSKNVNESVAKNLNIKSLKIKLESKDKDLEAYDNITFRYISFNQQGKIVKKERFEPYNDLVPQSWIDIYEYDKNNNVIKEESSRYTRPSDSNYEEYNLESSYISKYKYNDKQQRIEELYYDEDSKSYKNRVHYKYDLKGNLIEEISSNERRLYVYDERDNLVKEIDLDEDTLLLRHLKYDKNNRKVELIKFRNEYLLYGDVPKFEKEKYFYDNKGNLIRSETYYVKDNDIDELIGKKEYVFDNKNRLISKTSIGIKYKVEFFTRFEYNKNNLLIKEIVHKGDRDSKVGAIFKTSYTFY